VSDTTQTTTTLAEAAANFATDPRPVLCLDTCDFLDVVRSFEEKDNAQSQMAQRLLKALNEESNRVHAVITFLVRHEWRQNVEGSRTRASGHLLETDQRLRRVLDCCEHAEIAVDSPTADFALLPLVQGLVDLAERLMGRALVLERDTSCVDRALSRVMDRRRPSHKGEIKDSIHLEHYLELSRRLRQANFSEPILFVSANKADFWDGQPQLHRELRDEFNDAGLQFFGRLEAALGRLGI
jgi:hypothetical protein